MYSQSYSNEEPMLYQQSTFNKNQTGQFSMAASQSMQPMDDGIIDDELINDRGEEITHILNSCTSILLRTGLTLQFLSLLLLSILYKVFGNEGFFTFDLYNNGGTLNEDLYYYATVPIILFVYLLGVFFVSSFQEFVADNSKATLGFRSGSRLVSVANLLQLITVLLRITQFSFTYFYFYNKWYGKFSQTKTDWSLYNFGILCETLSLFMYGIGFYYMESYSDHGVGENIANNLLILFSLAGLFELIMLITGFGSFFTIILLFALLYSCFWAYQFEPLLVANAPLLYSRDINADVLPKEQGQFAEDPTLEKVHATQNFQPNFTYQLYAGANNSNTNQYGIEMQQ